MNEIIPLVSFPKSGNTWMRFILSNIFKKDRNFEVNFHTINKISPTAHTQQLDDFSKLLKEGSPLFIKEHYDFFSMPYKNYNKVIYIYRNGFDTLLSYWHFRTAQSPDKYPNIETFSKYYWTEFGHWGEHLHSWLFEAKKHNLLVYGIKYEELLKDPVNVICDCLNELGYSISKECINDAISLSTKDKMKKMNGSDKFMKSKVGGFHFVRSATIGEGEKELSKNCKENFLSYYKNFEMMYKFNYLEINDWKDIKIYKNVSLKEKIIGNFYEIKYRIRYKLQKISNDIFFS
jgi:hypothetical protein